MVIHIHLLLIAQSRCDPFWRMAWFQFLANVYCSNNMGCKWICIQAKFIYHSQKWLTATDVFQTWKKKWQLRFWYSTFIPIWQAVTMITMLYFWTWLFIKGIMTDAAASLVPTAVDKVLGIVYNASVSGKSIGSTGSSCFWIVNHATLSQIGAGAVACLDRTDHHEQSECKCIDNQLWAHEEIETGIWTTSLDVMINVWRLLVNL